MAPEDLTFGLARMYEAYAHSVPWEFKVFRAMDPALAWLGLPGSLLNEINQDSLGGGEKKIHCNSPMAVRKNEQGGPTDQT